MKEGVREKVSRWLTGIASILVVIAGLVFTYPFYERRCAALKRENEIDTRIAEKKSEIEALRTKQHRFRTDREFVEAIARQNNRVFPGELVFIFEEE